MSDQHDAGSLPELTPEQESAVRRLLAEARHDEPIPADVAARLDRVLAGLTRDEPGAPGVAPVIDLAARRRRRNAAAAAGRRRGGDRGGLRHRPGDRRQRLGRRGDDATSADAAADRDGPAAGPRTPAASRRAAGEWRRDPAAPAAAEARPPRT